MSTDSSELTFVRCPSCRSLVPAASSRCKMCGASLDVSAQPDQSEEERKKSGRVRQHTMTQDTKTQSSSELNASSEDLDGQSDSIEDLDDDPFDIFDMDEEDESMTDDSVKEDPMTASATEESVADAEENPLSSFLPEDDLNDSTQEKDIQSVKPIASNGQPNHGQANNGQQSAEPKEAFKPKVTIESGARPAGKPSGLSFSKPKNENTEQTKNRPSNERTIQARQAATERKPFEENVSKNQSNETVQQRPQTQQKGENQKMTFVKDRLFGWFVSYDNAEGSAIELREGRFFISGSLLKPNDMVIPDRGLSTPHVLASVSSSGGLRIQDLMSESGLFVRKKNAGTYTKEETSVQLEHGDWVKFGEIEFLVALISNSR